MGRFHDEKLNVPNLNIEMVTSILIQGLKPGRLLSNIAMDPPTSLDALYKEVDRCINEEEVLLMKQRNDGGSRREERRPIKERLGTGFRRTSPPRHNRLPLNVSMTAILKEIEGKVNLQYPGKMVNNPQKRSESGKYCRFHKDVGHDTEDCRQLKAEIERLLQEGYLTEFLDNLSKKYGGSSSARKGKNLARSKSPPQRRRRSPSPDRKDRDLRQVLDEKKKGVIYTIAGGTANGDSSNSRRRSLRSLQQEPRSEVYSVTTRKEEISFGPRDLEGIHLPHSDPLVVTMDVAYFDVRRVLVDSGSSADIIFLSTFEQLGLEKSRLRPVRTPLQGFGGATIEPLGSISLPTKLGHGNRSRVETIDFLVVDAPFAYNAILGRPGLNKFEAVASTLHLKMKFPTEAGVGEVRGDQRQARSCYLTSLKSEGSDNSGSDSREPRSAERRGEGRIVRGLGKEENRANREPPKDVLTQNHQTEVQLLLNKITCGRSQ